MKTICFEILQKDTFLKFLSEMIIDQKQLILEFDFEKDLVIAKVGTACGFMIKKDELKLSEVFKFNSEESDISVEKINGRVFILIADLDTLVKTTKKFVSDGDKLILIHEDFKSIVNRKSGSNRNFVLIDVPSVDVDQTIIKTKEKITATFTMLSGEIAHFHYLTDSTIEEINNKDNYEFKVVFDEKELKHLFDLCKTFSSISEHIEINIKGSLVTFIAKDSWEFSLNDSKVEGNGELNIVISNSVLKDIDISNNFNTLKIGSNYVTFTNDDSNKTLLMLGNVEEMGI